MRLTRAEREELASELFAGNLERVQSIAQSLQDEGKAVAVAPL